MLDVLNDTANIGITVLGSGVGVRFLFSGVKIFIKDIFPLLKAPQSDDLNVRLARIETKLDASIQAHSAHDKCIDEIYNRLRLNETETAIIKSKLK